MVGLWSTRRLAEYRKGLVALVGVLGQLVTLGVLSGTALHVATVVLAVLTAAGVVGVTNADPLPEALPLDDPTNVQVTP